jgi:hypothetical protein
MKLQMMFLFAAACSASVDGSNPAGGGDDEGVGNDDIRFRLTAIADERADVVDFASGEPVHTHAAPTTQLGGADCPDVHKHAYLMDVAAPPFGREASPNPLAWTIDAAGPAEYRLRGEASTIRDWTTVEANTIELRRDVVTSGKHLLDVRVGDSVATTCFVFHPLAAPLETLAPAFAPAGLADMTFAAGAPISKLLGDEFIPVFAQRFAHHTAESVELVIDATKPVTTFDRRAVDDYIALPLVALTTVCSDVNGSTGAPVCNDTPVPTANIETASGALTTGTWALRILDEATNTVTSHCTFTQLRATCTLPARAPTGATQRYRAVLYVANVPELAPFGNASVSELALAGQTFTGRILETQKRCAELRYKTIGGVEVSWCIKEAHHVHMQAMDTMKLVFAPQTLFTLTTTTAAPFTQPSLTWDAGDADLPGAQ